MLTKVSSSIFRWWQVDIIYIRNVTSIENFFPHNIPCVAKILLFGTNTFKLVFIFTLEKATYSIPCRKTEVRKSRSTYSNFWPWDFCIIIASAGLTRNWCLCSVHPSWLLVESKVILGICTYFPVHSPMKIFYLIILLYNSIISFIPLHNPSETSTFLIVCRHYENIFLTVVGRRYQQSNLKVLRY